MDILEPLKNDHDRIDELLEQIELADSRGLKVQIFNTLSHELQTHFKYEESSFLNFLEAIPALEETVAQFYDEHIEINDTLEEAWHLRDHADFDERVEDLIDLVLDHMDAEESVLYPKVETSLSADELELLAQKLEAARPNLSPQKMAA